MIKDFEDRYNKIEKENSSLELKDEELDNLKEKLSTKDKLYKYVADDLHKAGVVTDDEFEIATNIARKVKPKEDTDKWKIKKKNDVNLDEGVFDYGI